jgi:DHA1 family bicyclomycin/chloramphenicol resistance-like MFS transporter
VMRMGIDGTLGVGAAMLALGGLGMVATVAFGFKSPFLLVLPVSVYLAGLGMVLPQSIAGAMSPFPDRAGAASSLLGFIQQAMAALCGAFVGWMLGPTAWPLALTVAAMGCATFAVWLATQELRARYAGR